MELVHGHPCRGRGLSWCVAAFRRTITGLSAVVQRRRGEEQRPLHASNETSIHECLVERCGGGEERVVAREEGRGEEKDMVAGSKINGAEVERGWRRKRRKRRRRRRRRRRRKSIDTTTTTLERGGGEFYGQQQQQQSKIIVACDVEGR